MEYYQRIAGELSLPPSHVERVMELLDEGATLPFIARYRKEQTGGMDEVQIASVRDRYEALKELDARRETVLSTIDKQGRLTPELKSLIERAESLAELEDIYLPYKPKRKTRATIAKEKGLEPLAALIFSEEGSFESQISDYVGEDKGVSTAEDALAGARDIIAEWINENIDARKKVREIFWSQGIVETKVIKGKENEGLKFKDYFEWKESIKDAPSHRILAMRRAEKEGIIVLDMYPNETQALQLLESQFITKKGATKSQLSLAIADSYKRLMRPSLETEIRLETKMKADQEAIKVFASNLKELLLASPLGQKRTLALDPGFRTGCKLVVLGSQGELLFNTAIYPNEPQREIAKSSVIVKELCERFQIEAIAIGNGTASRETENFVKGIGLDKALPVVMVNESGASVYSASDVARAEFPDHDVTVRGAVSIGRRLMDPLAELVKLDPKVIGVGQYQHDVDQTKLKAGLDDTVMSCVNQVGVEVNTASKELLSYVSGLGPSLAENIISYRNTNGPFGSRQDLKKVPRLGDKAFEQSAGFLRIRNSAHPLDASAVHPERYSLVERFAQDLGCSVTDLISKQELRKKLDLRKYINDEVGLPTLNDILQELEKPGRDPRQKFEVFQFEEGVQSIGDLRPGMELPGIVTNVTNFGAFVDIGVHQDGLVHISHLSNRFIKDPKEVVSVQQKVKVTVLEVDVERKRISLSMKTETSKAPAPSRKSERREKEESMDTKLAQLVSKFKK